MCQPPAEGHNMQIDFHSNSISGQQSIFSDTQWKWKGAISSVLLGLYHSKQKKKKSES